MQRAAQREARAKAPAGTGANPIDAQRRRKPDPGTRPTGDELAAFYAELVNSDRYLPANTISNTLRDAMLSRGLVTPERLRMRGVR